MKMYSKINLQNTQQDSVDFDDTVVVIDTRKDVNFGETFLLYCANNDIDATSVDDNEFDAIVNLYDSFAQGARKDGEHKIKFWVDK